MYTVNEIINGFSMNNPHFTGLIVGFLAANLIGLLEYFWAVALTIKEKKGPFPVWMHTFFLAHDSTAAVIFTGLALQYHYFWVFTVYALGMYTWTIMELFCLYMEVKYARGEILTGGQDSVTTRQATTQIVIQTIVMYCIVNGLRILMRDQAMFIWLPLTNFVMAIGPGYVLQQRRSREGSSALVYIFIIFGTLLNFAPKGIGFFTSILPSIFNQPFWFIIGGIATVISLINLRKILQLPNKPQRTIW